MFDTFPHLHEVVVQLWVVALYADLPVCLQAGADLVEQLATEGGVQHPQHNLLQLLGHCKTIEKGNKPFKTSFGIIFVPVTSGVPSLSKALKSSAGVVVPTSAMAAEAPAPPPGRARSSLRARLESSLSSSSPGLKEFENISFATSHIKTKKFHLFSPKSLLPVTLSFLDSTSCRSNDFFTFSKASDDLTAT